MRKFSLGLLGWFLAAVCCLGQNTATQTGILTDSQSQAWINATWTAVPVVSAGGNAFYHDGTPVPKSFSGQLTSAGSFTGGSSVGRTSQMVPTGTTLRYTICSVTSQACSVINGVTVTSTTFSAGAFFGPLVVAPQIQASALVFAYNQNEVINPVQGTSYINTVDGSCHFFSGTMYTNCGSSGGGNVNPGAQQQVTFYPVAGTNPTVGPVPTGFTSDNVGNAHNHTNTETMTNEVNVGSITQNSDSCLNAGCNQELQLKNYTVNSYGPGKNVGNLAGLSNQDSGWRVTKGPQFQFNIFNSGIAQLRHVFGNSHASGDKAIEYVDGFAGASGIWSGGFTDQSGEGDVGYNVNSSQFDDFCLGTTSTTATGSTSPVVNCTNARNKSLTEHGYLINYSHTLLQSNINGAASVIWETNPLNLGSLNISTAVATPSTGICVLTTYVSTSTVYNTPQSQSFTCTTHDAKAIGTGLAWIANGSTLEQVNITGVSGSGTITGTMLAAQPHPIGSYIFQGGTQGCLEFDDDFTALGNFTDFPVFGADDSSHLIIGFPVGGSLSGIGLPYTGAFVEQPTSGVHVFPCARIISLQQDGVTNVLEQNNVPWTAGDNVAGPMPVSYLETGFHFGSTARWTNPNDISKGFYVSGNGGGQTSAFHPFHYENFTNPSLYVGNGGHLFAPPVMTADRTIGTWFDGDNPLPEIDDPTTGTVFSNKNTSNSNSTINFWADRGVAGNGIVDERSTNTWIFQSNLQADNQLQIGGGGGVFGIQHDALLIRPVLASAGFTFGFGPTWDFGSALPLAHARHWYNLDAFVGPGVYCQYFSTDVTNTVALKLCSDGSGNEASHFTGIVDINGNVVCDQTGNCQPRGRIPLVAGTATVTGVPSIGATSNVQLTNCASGGTPGLLSVGTIVAGTSFVINSASALDTSTICWLLP